MNPPAGREVTTLSLLKRPSAFLPVAMSLLALGVIGTRVAVMGTAPEPDEGTAAHLWQLLMVGQIPVIAWFAATSLWRSPREAFPVLAVQILAGIAAAAPVFLLRF